MTDAEVEVHTQKIDVSQSAETTAVYLMCTIQIHESHIDLCEWAKEENPNLCQKYVAYYQFEPSGWRKR